MEPEARYGIEELAELGGVSRRAVRFYVQEGLLPPPLGVGRGRHYGPEHLVRLLEVKAMQERGLSLSEIRERRGASGAAEPPAAPAPVLPPRSAWVRLELAPGIELHVAGDRKLPPPARLAELARWCRRWLHPSAEENDDA